MQLNQLVTYLQSELNLNAITDYPNAVNGLQLANRKGAVTRIIAAVDAVLPVMREAVARGGDLLLVHHGMFWAGLQPITDSYFEKVSLCMEANLAVYSAHLPLDFHPVMGNDVLLARALGFEPCGTFMKTKGSDNGALIETEIARAELLQRLEDATGFKPHLAPGGPQVAKRIGIMTGGAGSEIAAVAKAGIDTFITGEGPHHTYTLAEELGVNLVYGGHYATETFGVKALAAHLAEKFGLSWEFVDHPTGL